MAFKVQDFYDGKLPTGGIMAAYLRFSSKNQEETSVDDQLRRCREVAAREGYTIPPHLVFTDKAISGRSMKNRPGLQKLVAAAKQSPEFQGVIIFDTARLARNVEELLHLYKVLRHRHIFLRVATTGLDSRMPGFDIVLMTLGSMDEKFVETLAENIFKGQEGKAKRGFNPGGTRYGYRNDPEEHETEIGLHGRPKVIGARELQIPEEAEIVLLIFTLYAAGWGIDKIAKHLNVKGVVPPGKPRNSVVPVWAPYTIRGILRNEIYAGKRVWGKFQKVKDPETGRTERRERPAEHWTIYEDKKLQIIPTELWERVQARIRQVEQTRGPRAVGGMSRTENSRRYIFSDTLYCSKCMSKMIAASGPPDRVRYVCGHHRAGKCANALTIRRSDLERQLMDRIVRQLQSAEFVDLIREEFERQVAGVIEAEAAKAAIVRDRREELRDEHASLVRKIDFYDEEIGTGITFETVRAKLRKCVSRKEEIEQMLEAEQKGVGDGIDRSELCEFLEASFNNLADVLLADPVSAKQEVLNRIDKLWLTPETRDGEKVYVVTGDVRLFSGDHDAFLPKALKGYREQCIGLRLTLDGMALEIQIPKNKSVKDAVEDIGTGPDLLEKIWQEIDTAALLAGWRFGALNSAETGHQCDVGTTPTAHYEYRDGFGGLRLAMPWLPAMSEVSVAVAIAE